MSVAASINVCRIPSASLQADSVPTVKSALVDASRSRQPRPAPRGSVQHPSPHAELVTVTA